MAVKRSTGPAYGQIWLYKQREIFILGNTIKDGLIWSADRITGERLDPNIDDLSLFDSGMSHRQEFNELLASAVRWARDGNADAAWWLGWYFQGTHHPKSVWYAIAAIRMNRPAFGWAFSLTYDNGCYGAVSSGTPYPSILFMKKIHEFATNKWSSDWQEAIQQAEISVHEAVSESQILEAIKLIEAGNQLRPACWQAGVSDMSLSSSTVYKQWLEQKEIQNVNENKRRCVAYRSGYDSGTKSSDISICPWPDNSLEREAWLDGHKEAIFNLSNPDLIDDDVPF